MAPITEKTILDQETGYSLLSEATKGLEPRRVAAAIVSAFALGAVAAVKTTSAKRAASPLPSTRS